MGRHVVEITYAFPAEMVRAATDVFLDGVGVMLASTQEAPGHVPEKLGTVPALRDLIAGR